MTWSESPDFANAVSETVPAEAASHEIYNLIPGRTYYCKVDAIVDEGTDGAVVSKGSFPHPLSRKAGRRQIRRIIEHFFIVLSGILTQYPKG